MSPKTWACSPVFCLLCVVVPVAQVGLARDATVALTDSLRRIAHSSELSDASSADSPDAQQLAAAMLEDGVLEQVLTDPAVARAVRAAQAERKSLARSDTLSTGQPTRSSKNSRNDDSAAQGRVGSSRTTAASSAGTHRPNAIQNLTTRRLLVGASLHRKLQNDISVECPAPEPARLQGATIRRQQLNFSAAYNVSLTCTWVITCAKHEALFVSFRSFSTLYGTGENSGYSDALSLHDGADDSAPLLNVLCGSATPTAFVAESGSMTLVLQYQYADTVPTFAVDYWCAAASTIVRGCTDPSSSSFDPTANTDDGSCYDLERQALLNSFELDLSSRTLQSWSATAEPCTCGMEVWEGVVCSQNRHVVMIDLHATDVTFVLGEAVAQLASLWSLSLWGSGLHGTMPRALANMALLQSIDLDETVLSGTIPPLTSQNLTEMILYKTQLSGTIPSSLIELTGLVMLSLSNTRVSGTLAEGIGKLRSIAELNVAKSAITGSLPVALGQISTLQCFDISDTAIDGYLPTMERMASLWSLSSDGTHISGTLAEALTRLPNFQSITTSFACCPLCSCCTNDNPPTLDLGRTGISGTLIGTMRDMKALGILGLGSTRLSGTIGIAIRGMTALQALSAAGTRVSGTLAKELTDLPQLRRLQMYSLRLSGTIPNAVRDLASLEILDLPDTSISGSIPPEIGTHLTVLTELSLYGCRLSGTLPPQFGHLNKLESIYIDSNTLTGPLPDLSGCRSLKVLRVTNNSFDSLPVALPNMVTHLYLDKNPLHASAANLSILTHRLDKLHTLSVGIVDVPIILESSVMFPDPRCNVPVDDLHEGCRGTWIKKPSSCRVGQSCSWQLNLRDADDQAAREGGLLKNLSIAYCGDAASFTCEHSAPMLDNRDGTFTATVPPSWIHITGQHAFRFFHEGREFHPTVSADNKLVPYDVLRTVTYDAVMCSPGTHRTPDVTGSKCMCMPGFASDGNQSSDVCLRQCTNGTIIVDDGTRCECPPNTYDIRHAGVVLCSSYGWTANRHDFVDTDKKLTRTGGVCVNCPTECASCAKGIATLSLGWRLNGTSDEQMQQLLRGPIIGIQPQFAYQCPGAGYDTVTCPPMLLSAATNTSSVPCLDHHTGPLCASCEQGFSRRGSDATCRPCGDTTVFEEHFNVTEGQFIGWSVASLLAAALLLQRNRGLLEFVDEHLSSLLRIALGLGQVLALLQDVLDLLFPPPPRRAISYTALASADLHTLYEFDCNGWDWYDTWILNVVCVPCACFGLVAAWYAHQRVCTAAGSTVDPMNPIDPIGKFFFVVLLLYPRVSSSILSAFRCRVLGEQMQVLEVDYSVSCIAGKYRAYRVIAWVLLMLWPVGIPACLLCWLWWQFGRNAPALGLSSTECCAEGSDDGRLAATDSKAQLMRRYAFCLEDYKPEAWWFEPIDMIRKLALSGLLQFVQRGTALQVLVGCCISFASFGMHIWLLPYKQPGDNALKVCAEAVLFLTFLISFILRVLPRVESYEPLGAEAYGYALVGAFVAFALLFVVLVACRVQKGLAAVAQRGFETDRFEQELAVMSHAEPQQPETNAALTRMRGQPTVEHAAYAMQQPLIVGPGDQLRARQSRVDRFYAWVASQ